MIAWTKCECGMRGYASVAAAKEAVSGVRNRIRVFRCSESDMHHVTDSDRNPRAAKTRREKAAMRHARRYERHKVSAVLRRACA